MTGVEAAELIKLKFQRYVGVNRLLELLIKVIGVPKHVAESSAAIVALGVCITLMVFARTVVSIQP